MLQKRGTGDLVGAVGYAVGQTIPIAAVFASGPRSALRGQRASFAGEGHPTAKLNNAHLNVASGTITFEEWSFVGSGLAS